jgi:hypothetical protein
MRQRTTSILAAGVLVGSLTAACDQAAEPEGLVITANTPERVAGSFRSSKQAISFESDVRGDELRVAVYGTGRAPLYVMSAAAKRVSIEVMGRLRSSFDPTTVDRNADMSGAVPSAGDPTAWKALFARPESFLLNTLPEIVRDAGIKREDSEAARGLQQVLGQLSAMSSKLAVTPAPQGLDLTSQAISSDSQCATLTCPPGYRKVHVSPTSSSCTCRRPPGPPAPCRPEYDGDLRCDPNHDNCLGMCGPGCACDTIYCGDCRFHQGCYVHDLACKTCTESYGLAVSACLVCATPLGLGVALTCRL